MTTTGETPAQIIARIKAENKRCKVCGTRRLKKTIEVKFAYIERSNHRSKKYVSEPFK